MALKGRKVRVLSEKLQLLVEDFSMPKEDPPTSRRQKLNTKISSRFFLTCPRLPRLPIAKVYSQTMRAEEEYRQLMMKGIHKIVPF